MALYCFAIMMSIQRKGILVYTIKLDINDTVYDKVMLFLKNVPIKNLEVKKLDESRETKKDDIVSFFRSSPLGDIQLERDKQTYQDRLSF
jgi:hypothetical protein